MQMPEKYGSVAKYRMGYNGMEKDDEIKGMGNSIDFGARFYDSRLGRWLSLDPLQIKYPYLSPYNYVANSPIMFIDPDGRYITIPHDKTSKEYIMISNALAVIKKIDPKEFAEIENSAVEYNISFSEKLLPPVVTKTETEIITSEYLQGNTKVHYQTKGIDFDRIIDDKGEVRDVTLLRTLIQEEKIEMIKAGKTVEELNEFKVIEKMDKELSNRIEVMSVDIELNYYDLPKKFAAENVLTRQFTTTVGHELIGHAFHDTIKNKVLGLIWTVIGNNSGHDKYNPSKKHVKDVDDKVFNEFKANAK